MLSRTPYPRAHHETMYIVALPGSQLFGVDSLVCCCCDCGVWECWFVGCCSCAPCLLTHRERRMEKKRGGEAGRREGRGRREEEGKGTERGGRERRGKAVPGRIQCKGATSWGAHCAILSLTKLNLFCHELLAPLARPVHRRLRSDLAGRETPHAAVALYLPHRHIRARARVAASIAARLLG